MTDQEFSAAFSVSLGIMGNNKSKKITAGFLFLFLKDIPQNQNSEIVFT